MTRRKRVRHSLRPPKPTFDRVKVPLIILAYIILAEWADPFPFHITLPARLAVSALILFILREFHHARLETDYEWAERSTSIAGKLSRKLAYISREARFRILRITVWAISTYVFGMVLNVLTDRCDSAIQCVMLAPRMAVENLPTFLQFALYISLTLFQLAVLFYTLVKVGSFKVIAPGTIDVSFDDVWGQDAAKAKVLEQVKLLEDSADIERAGGYMPKGILLYGPPGTGKTLLAKAAAGFSSKPLILVPPGAFQSTFMGIPILKIWALFRNVRKYAARYGGVIVFIDEIDSLGSRGGEVSRAEPTQEWTRAPGCIPWETRMIPESPDNSPRRIIIGTAQMGVLESFLAAMDGLDDPRGLVNRILVALGFKPMKPPEYKYLIIGATNMMNRLDPALLRAGRFGRKIHVTYPKVEGRLRTYEGYLKKVKHTLEPRHIDWAARNHANGTGAEIKDIVNEALLITYRDDRKDPGVIHFDDLMKAMLWVKFGESDGPFDRNEARWAVAVHEAGHAVAFHYLNRSRQKIWMGTVEQYGSAGGMVIPSPIREDWLLTHSELMSDIIISLASRVAEEIILGEQTNGHGGDGAHATALAEKVVKLGLSTQIGIYDKDHAEMRKQVEEVLRRALQSTRELLSTKREQIEIVARLLYERNTVDGDTIHEALDTFDSNSNAEASS